MSTKQADGKYVHELSISAADLEQRYKQGEVRLVYLPFCIVSASGPLLDCIATAKQLAAQLPSHAFHLCPSSLFGRISMC